MHYLQDLIAKLTDFWAKKGCATHFGYDLETGAGTFNPITFFRSLGPEPYNAAYLEPSRRPSDGRYGTNPNRMQYFLQFQVILKPSPLNIQQLYLESLQAIGLDPKKHDIRFVHDDWKSPTLGAWGLGWEVWVDGMEASQFTYFQSFGGIELDVIPGEITYGFERLAMYLQNVDNVYDLKWNQDLTYGDIYHQNEVEWSTYNFEESNVNLWLTTFDLSEKETLTLLDKNLPIPAYDFVIKASHAFNMLDARGVISVSERTNYINRVRNLACRVAKQFLAQREKMGYPLLKEVKEIKESKAIAHPSFDAHKIDNFILEIKVEELPQTFIPIGIENLKKDLERFLKDHKIAYSNLSTYGSPRRLVAYIQDLAYGSSEEFSDRKGPQIDKAFNNLGLPTAIGCGFLDAQKLPHYSLKEIYEEVNPFLRIEDVKGVKYLFAVQHKPSESTHAIFCKHMPSLILNLDFPKKMIWSDLKVAFPRPIQSLLAMHGKTEVPFSIAGITASNTTHGHPALAPEKITLKKATDYFEALENKHVIVDQSKREELILSQLSHIENLMSAKATHVSSVMKEVLYLCESPELICASFDEKYLEAPKELIELVLITHQRYFPLVDLQGNLLPHFVVCLDTKANETIKKGNQKAVSPRLSDGLFLFHQDLKYGLDHFAAKLKTITFQQEIGTLEAKAKRLLKEAELINQSLKLSASKKEQEMAALYLKADLASHVVFEFPELQGIMGKIYAEKAQLPTNVSEAIFQHWLPRFEEDELPTNSLGILYSLADKIDNLLASFLTGNIPTSSSDPFALRRQALGIIRILIEHKLHLPLREILKKSIELFNLPKVDAKHILEELVQFMESRAKTVLTSYKLKPDEIQAVLDIKHSELDIYDLFLRARSLHQFKEHALFESLLEVYKRAKGQLNIDIKKAVNSSLFCEKEEKTLYKHFVEIEAQFHNCLEQHLYSECFHLLATLHPHLASLFEHVKIMVDDEHLRMNRLALLHDIIALFNKLFNFSLVVKG